jgi:predicted DNA-binding transcriptional regulator AlpA
MTERLHKIVRRRMLPQFSGLQRTQTDELIKRGEFPQPVPLSDTGRAVGWLEDELVAWQRGRLARRDEKGRNDVPGPQGGQLISSARGGNRNKDARQYVAEGDEPRR